MHPSPRFPQSPVGSADHSLIPLVASFGEQTPTTYIVRNLHDGDEVFVLKERAIPEIFPPTDEEPVRGLALLRWSSIALVLAFLGGVGGIVIGVLTLVASCIGLMRFAQRARRWRRAHAEVALPVTARGERDRLRAGVGQSVIALAIAGSLMLVLLHRHP